MVVCPFRFLSIGEKALDYLHKRGLTDETIKRFCIGYWPQWMEQQYEKWGLASDDNTPTFWLRPGITIPTFAHDTLWKITLRILEYTPNELARARETGKDLPRYRQVVGSSNSLFNVDAIRPDQPVFMTEGEFDAMIGEQETDLPFVATGSTSGAMLARWITRLTPASHIFLAFDNDDGKGEKAAQEWCKIFAEKATVWLPTAKKDITDMWLQKQDLRQWVAIAVASSSDVPAPPAETHKQELSSTKAQPSPEVELPQDEQHLCYECLNVGLETPATFVGPDDIMYCRTHYSALPSEVHKADMEKFAERCRQEFPGWTVTVEPISTPNDPNARKASEKKPTQDDFWAELERKLAKFDPTKPVDWTEYGYKRDNNGRWYYGRRPPVDIKQDTTPENE